MALAIDVSAGKTGTPTFGSPTLTSNAFTTTAANEIVVVLVGVSSTRGGGSDTVTTTVTGAGLSWTLAKRANTHGDHTAEVWWAPASSVLTARTVTVTVAQTGPDTGGTVYSIALHVLSFTGANTGSPIGATGSATAANGTGGTVTTTLTTTAGSYCVAAGADYWNNHAPAAGTGQTLLTAFNDTTNGEVEWTQRTTSTTGTSQTMNQTTSFGTDGWVFVAAEILAASGGATVMPPPPLIVRQAVQRAAVW